MSQDRRGKRSASMVMSSTASACPPPWVTGQKGPAPRRPVYPPKPARSHRLPAPHNHAPRSQGTSHRGFTRHRRRRRLRLGQGGRQPHADRAPAPRAGPEAGERLAAREGSNMINEGGSWAGTRHASDRRPDPASDRGCAPAAAPCRRSSLEAGSARGYGHTPADGGTSRRLPALSVPAAFSFTLTPSSPSPPLTTHTSRGGRAAGRQSLPCRFRPCAYPAGQRRPAPPPHTHTPSTDRGQGQELRRQGVQHPVRGLRRPAGDAPCPFSSHLPQICLTSTTGSLSTPMPACLCSAWPLLALCVAPSLCAHPAGCRAPWAGPAGIEGSATVARLPCAPASGHPQHPPGPLPPAPSVPSARR